jgi:hypothetical protein
MMMKTTDTRPVRIYDGEGDALFLETGLAEKLILAPEAQPLGEGHPEPRLRLMWGQYLLDDLLAGRYRSLICAANIEDNAHGIIGRLASLLPGCQWTHESVTAHARQFSKRDEVTVLKYDMGLVEVLALLRPADRDALTLTDLGRGFGLITQLLKHHSQWRPIASVSFLEGRSNRLEDEDGQPPSFESVLRVMYEAGFAGDVYPSPAMFEAAPTAVFSRFPFPPSLDQMRTGGS